MQIPMILTVLLSFCLEGLTHSQQKSVSDLPPQNNTLFEHVGDIPLPDGYSRIDTAPASFGSWLRKIRLRKDNVVYLYDGTRKPNQQAQFAVLEKPVGKKDLQQCADAVMRLRAEYLLDAGRDNEICFIDNAGRKYLYNATGSSLGFERYLERVYSYCGTASLSRQLKKVKDFEQIKPGDILIKGGFPGHAVIVMDVAMNRSGRKIYMVAQSYMPAQSIHVLKNPSGNSVSPWYVADNSLMPIVTPEWTFTTDQLMEW